MPLILVEVSAALLLLSGVPDLPRLGGPRATKWVGSLIALIGSALGVAASVWALTQASEASQSIPWNLPGGDLDLGLDPLSAFFLVPIFLVGGLGTLYQIGYWDPASHPRNLRAHRFFWGLLQGGLALLVLARNGVAFLFGWEVMALSAFFLISTEDQREEVREAAWVYLVATHVGTLSLFGMFSLLWASTGSFGWGTLDLGGQEAWRLWVLFALAIIGFGLKAGLMPLHFWLPGAHANAPSHVSAMLSGVVIKMGIYGLARLLSMIPQPPLSWGGLLLLLGAVSCVGGVLFAIGQHDLKRLLAYHSVENIGIILMGLGLALIGRSTGRRDLLMLGMAGCLLHVWNHGLFKPLLFFGAGAVLHTTHTREMDALGGLAGRMPWTAGLFLVGALSICGLPPFNGFVSELFIYLGFFRGLLTVDGASYPAVALGAPILAIVGALAVACFVKVYGAVFLGSPRSSVVASAQEPPLTMRSAMAPLAAACVGIGVAPFLVARLLEHAVRTWGGESLSPVRAADIEAWVPLGWLTFLGLALILSIGVLFLRFSRALGRSTARSVTWDCGYAAPTPRMQYTSSSFAKILVDQFSWVLHPKGELPQVRGFFPTTVRSHSWVEDRVLGEIIHPLAKALERLCARLRPLQQGKLQAYLLYMFIILGILLIWGALGAP